MPDLNSAPKCRECGAAIETPFAADPRYCLVCGHFLELTDLGERSIRINGVHYMAGPEGVAKEAAGYGGRRHRIVFTDGRVIETSNLWCQGKIPLRFIDRLPNNAAFDPA